MRSGAIGWKLPDFLSDGGNNVCTLLTFICQNSRLKSLTFKLLIKITAHNIRMVPFDGKYQPIYKSYLSIFQLLSPFSSCSHFKIRDLENVDQGHDVQHIRSGAIRWQIYDFLSDSNSNCLQFSSVYLSKWSHERFAP